MRVYDREENKQYFTTLEEARELMQRVCRENISFHPAKIKKQKDTGLYYVSWVPVSENRYIQA
jgi:hypothetical protein